MSHAWLDSLSEDWPSQPSIEDSLPPQLPTLHSDENNRSSSFRAEGDRQSVPSPKARQDERNSYDNSANVLSERNSNEKNIPSSTRKASKLSPTTRSFGADRQTSRAFSHSTTGSVVHNTVAHRSPGGSALKNPGDTPEWKRRLVYGEVAYGEQADLFCSAANGLENIFKPPPPTAPRQGPQERPELCPDSTFPSSPPIYRPAEPETPDYAEQDEEDDDYLARAREGSPSPSPRRPYDHNTRDDSHEVSTFSNRNRDHDSQEQDAASRESAPKAATSLAPPADASRKTSGQSVVRNEDFSPIMMSCRETGDGKIDFAPDLPPDQLRNRLENLRINQALIDSDAAANLDFSELDSEDNAAVRTETTDDFARHGGFINVQRGGRSTEGSFRRRGLSPGMIGDTSEMLPEESLQASTPKQFPTIRINEMGSKRFASISPPPLRAPFPSPEKQGFNYQANAGSPLKLFGPYDTFTNQTLLRRISQFEEHSSDSSRHSGFGPTERSVHPTVQVSAARPPSSHHPDLEQASSRSVSQFGRGDLEGYKFSSDPTAWQGDELGYDEENDPLNLAAAVGSSIRFEDGDASPIDAEDMVIPKHRQSADSPPAGFRRARTTSASSQQHPTRPQSSRSEAERMMTPKRDSGSEGKRPRTSPSKDPTPKRRRTLHKSDVAYVHGQQHGSVEVVQNVHSSMQSIMGRKRREGQADSLPQTIQPDLMSVPHMFRPRTPTPSQRSSIQRERQPSFDVVGEGASLGRPSTRDSQSAASSNDKSQPLETNRKPSIKTQDFVDQAGAIMAMIRTGDKPPSGLASVEESEAEHGVNSVGTPEDSFEDSTREPFSRPPSRDGKPVARDVPAHQQDPKILDHLKKYQELSDMGDVISSSLRSMSEAQEAIRAAQEVERRLHESERDYSGLDSLDDLNEIVSDPPNIRISHASPAELNDDNADFPSNSSGGSTNRSIPTGSSRGSDSRKTIAPQSVSHLIPDQVGSMYLDRHHNIWVKRKDSGVREQQFLPSEDSEEDPFASIPDLSVDVTREIRNLRLVTTHQPIAGEEELQSSRESLGTPRSQKERNYVTLSPNGAIPDGMTPQARDEINKLEGSKTSPVVNVDEATEEMKMRAEDRANRETPSRKNLTISFSSPIASIIHDMSSDDIDNLEDDTGSFLERTQGSRPVPSKTNAFASLSKSARKKLQPRARSVSRGPARHMSVHGHAFIPRPVSRIDEQDEEAQQEKAYAESRQVSIIGDNSVVSHASKGFQQRSLSVVLSTPGARDKGDVVISQNVGNLSLSPLSEFTMQNQDQSFGLEVSYVVDDRHLVTGDGSKRVLSMTVRELVDRLTQVEPFEPNWDDFRELDISDKRLSSLHMLDEFCGRLVTLDASSNSLAHLEGIPTTVRQLKVSDNMLTDLTSWDHLANLQYVDVSNNELQSLSVLRDLVHLRSVKADNNRLTSLDGLEFHDGLLVLRARDNCIEELDFGDSKLDRLVELDLSGNDINTISNISQLPALETLKLQRNKLKSFTPDASLQRMRCLDLSDNDVQNLDISFVPSLRMLHADRNCINEITGFARARHLDSISLREQRIDGKLDLSFLSAAYEVRKLFLSGNAIGKFEPRVDFLNLQLLELANCGLCGLPDNLGQLMPNLRSLNVNFNAIDEIGSLRFIPRLKKLLMAGNRLANSTQVTEILTEFPHLSRLDLRDNPMTLGFYPPLQVIVPVNRTGYADPFTLPDADGERDRSFASRLDETTRLRRRLHQVVFVGCCKRLKMLDGLAMERKTVLTRDALLDTLMADGLLPGEVTGTGVGVGVGEPSGKEMDDSSRWNAEDSFA